MSTIKPTLGVDKDQLVKDSRRTREEEEIKVLLINDKVPPTIHTLRVSSPHREIDILYKMFSNNEVLQSTLGTIEVMAQQSVIKVASLASQEYILESMAPCISSKIRITPVNDAAYQYSLELQPPKIKPHQFNYFENVFNDKTFSDVTLCVDGREIFAHKVVLANRSPVFDALLNSTCNRFEIKDVSYETMLGLVHYIYKGIPCNYNCSKDDFTEFSNLLKADTVYCVEGLKDMCEEKLYSLLTIENAVECLNLADAHGAVSLTQQVIRFIAEKAEHIFKLPSYARLAFLHQDVLVTLLQLVASRKKSVI